MNPEIIFTNETKVRALSASLVFKTIRRALVLSNLGGQPISLSVNLVSRTKMRQLNRQWRAEDKPTDVLSFPIGLSAYAKASADAFQSKLSLKARASKVKQKGDIIQSELSSVDLGDIFLCPAVVRTEAALFALTEKQLSIRLLIHGLLHLLGYEHTGNKRLAGVMLKQEQKIIDKLLTKDYKL